jgi:hypothetical protein
VREGDATIRIGGVEGAFVPMLELQRWDSQFIRLRLLHDEPGIVSVDQQAIVWTTPSLEARWYRLPDQRYEFATVFYGAVPECVRFAYETSADVETTHQPFLAHVAADGSTWEPNGRGGERRRPVDVGNSFVAYVPWSGDYTRCGGWNYQSGKVAHLFRPWIVDAVGHHAWCPVTLARGILTITIPQDFRASALGPCLLDPTFGYSGTAASDDNIGGAWVWAKANTNPSSNGSLTSMTVRGRLKAGTTSHFDPAIYSDSSATPDAKLAAVDSGGTVFTGSDSDISTNISYGSLVNGTQYWLGNRSNASNGTSEDAWFKFDASGGSLNAAYIVDGPPYTNPYPATAAGYTTLNNEKIYIYGTFTASGGGAKSGSSILLSGVGH